MSGGLCPRTNDCKNCNEQIAIKDITYLQYLSLKPEKYYVLLDYNFLFIPKPISRIKNYISQLTYMVNSFLSLLGILLTCYFSINIIIFCFKLIGQNECGK